MKRLKTQQSLFCALFVVSASRYLDTFFHPPLFCPKLSRSQDFSCEWKILKTLKAYSKAFSKFAHNFHLFVLPWLRACFQIINKRNKNIAAYTFFVICWNEFFSYLFSSSTSKRNFALQFSARSNCAFIWTRLKCGKNRWENFAWQMKKAEKREKSLAERREKQQRRLIFYQQLFRFNLSSLCFSPEGEWKQQQRAYKGRELSETLFTNWIEIMIPLKLCCKFPNFTCFFFRSLRIFPTFHANFTAYFQF